jgi:hypothetical protein
MRGQVRRGLHQFLGHGRSRLPDYNAKIAKCAKIAKMPVTQRSWSRVKKALRSLRALRSSRLNADVPPSRTHNDSPCPRTEHQPRPSARTPCSNSASHSSSPYGGNSDLAPQDFNTEAQSTQRFLQMTAPGTETATATRSKPPAQITCRLAEALRSIVRSRGCPVVPPRTKAAPPCWKAACPDWQRTHRAR